MKLSHAFKRLFSKTHENFNSLTQEEQNQQLLAAAGKGDNTKIQTLIQSGAEIETQSLLGHTALMFACCTINNTSTVSLLIQLGANVNASSLMNQTVLIRAASAGNTSAVILLLQAGANINIVDRKNDTALLCAIKKNHIDTAAILLQATRVSLQQIHTTLMLEPNFNIIMERAIKENKKNMIAIFANTYSNRKTEISFLDLPVELLVKILCYILPTWYSRDNITNDILSLSPVQNRLQTRATIKHAVSRLPPAIFFSAPSTKNKEMLSINKRAFFAARQQKSFAPN